MLKNALQNNSIKCILLYFWCILVWWVVLFVTGSVNSLSNYLFAFAFGFIPVLGGTLGLINFRKWWSFKSSVGKALMYISLGLLTWGLGQIIFSLYNLLLDIEVPYPSIADASFVLSWPLWGMGIYYLSRTTGAKFGLRSIYGKFALLIIPLVTIPLSYYVLVVIARDGVLFGSESLAKLFFDLAYPIGSVVLLTMIALVYSLSIRYLGGKFKAAVYLVLIGIMINYIADFSFSYTTTIGTFYSGNWVDLIFATAMFVLALGVNILNPNFLKQTES